MNQIETQLTEILQLAQEGESKFKTMSDSATIMAEKWRIKSDAFAQSSEENDTANSHSHRDTTQE
jgi:hypothetical protein